jgi:hypothetical protein
MANEPIRPRGRSWRDDSGIPKSKALRPWQQDGKETAAAGVQFSRGAKFWILTFCLMTIVAAMVWVILWVRRWDPPSLIVIYADYHDNLAIPHNVFGRKIVEDLKQWRDDNAKSPIVGLQKENLHDWEKLVDETKSKTIVIYFALHGGVDAEGNAYLFPHDLTPADGKDKRLYIREILDKLNDDKLKKKQKVLILDPTQVTANVAFGMLTNDFVRALKRNEAIAKIPNLIVICSSDEDQRSWPSNVVSKTIFGHFLVEGLKGAAKEGGESKISAYHLFQYLSNEVPKWVTANRETVQKPILLPEGAEATAKKIILAHVDKPYAEPPMPDPAAKFWNTEKYQEIWKKYKYWDERNSATYHPVLWRKFRDNFLRFEQLLCAGDEAASGHIAGRINALANILAENPLAELTCLENAFPLQRIFETEIGDQLKNSKLAEEELANFAKPDKGPANGLKAQLSELAAKLRNWFPRSRNRPAEAHYPIMLDHFYASKERKVPTSGEYRNYVQLAVTTRLLAERAAVGAWAERTDDSKGRHPVYAERIFSWIKDDLNEADKERRFGEDKLFSGQNEDWGEKGAKKHLEFARDSYTKILKKAKSIATALQILDEVCGDLPYFAQWVLCRHLTPDNQVQIQKDVKSIEDLWQKSHTLADALEKKSIEELDKAAAEIQAAMDGLKKSLQRQGKELPTSQIAASQGAWHDYEAFLSGPISVEGKPRETLWQTFSTIDVELFTKTHAEEAGAAKPQRPMFWRAGQNQGRLAWALLGEKRMGAASPKEFLTDESKRLPETLSERGHEIAAKWLQVPAEIQDLMAKNQDDKIDLKTVLENCQIADRMCRQCATSALDTMPEDPPNKCRKLQLHHLLVGLGQRTVDDRWFDEQKTPEHYFHFAAERYFNDAKKLVGNWNDSAQALAEFNRLKNFLQLADGMLLIAGERDKKVTTQTEYVLKYQLEGKDVPEGYAVVDVSPSPELHLDSSAGNGAQIRPIGAESKAQELQFLFKNPPSKEPKEKGENVVLAWYRGLVPAKESGVTHVTLYHQPDIVAKQTRRPEDSGIAVRMDPSVEKEFARSKGVISIILDCSGSMWHQTTGLPFKIDSNADTATFHKNLRNLWSGELSVSAARKYQTENKSKLNRRFDKALNALEAVLKDLPPGVTITIWTYGQADTSHGQVRRLVEPLKWNQDQLEGLMAKLRELVPYYETPLVRAMYEAKVKDFPKDTEGFKTMVVLTDGMDQPSDTDRDEWYIPRGFKKSTAEFIRPFLRTTFEKSEISVQMILFDVPKKEQPTAEDQFGVINDTFVRPSHLYIAPDEIKLRQNLKKAMNPELRFRLYQNGTLIGSDDGLRVTPNRLRHLPDWYQPPKEGSYEIRVHGNETKKPQKIHVNPGDFLLLDCKKDRDGFVFDRCIFAKEQERTGNYVKTAIQGHRLFGLLQNQIVDKSLRLTVSLEDNEPRDPNLDYLVISRPRFVWFELKSNNELIPFAWENHERYPAPAWSLEVPNWSKISAAAKPAISMWWTDDQDPLRSTWKLQTISRKPGESEYQNVIVAGIDQGSLSHAVRFENYNRRKCLVVRLTFPKDEPIIVLPQDDALRREQEHQLFLEANQYTGVFYDTSEGDAINLDVVSLKKFKKDAKSVQVVGGAPSAVNIAPKEIVNPTKIASK